MGIKFRCHVCQFPMNVKDFQAGKKSRCPKCDSRFRIPFVEQDFSIPLTANELAKDKGFNPIESEEAAATTSQTANAKVKVTPDQAPIQTAAAAVPSKPTIASKPSPELASKQSKGFKVDSTTWMVRIPSGEQFGPAPDALILEWIREDRVTSDCMLRREGSTEWLPAPQCFPTHFSTPVPEVAPVPVLASTAPTNPKPAASSNVTPTEITASDSPLAFLEGAAAAAHNPLDNLPSATSQQRALLKKKQKRRQQIRWIIGLSLLAMLLLIILIAVIIWNPAAYYGGKPQSDTGNLPGIALFAPGLRS